MATGFCPHLLNHVNMVAKTATPQNKIRPTGYLGMLMTENTPGAIKVDQGNGAKSEFRVKYKKRYRIADTDTSASCDQVLVPSYVEDTIVMNNYRQLAIHIEDSVIEQYCIDAQRTVALGLPATDLMQEFYDSTILQGANALLGAVNRDVINLQKSRFGVNIATGLATATTVNFPQATTTIDLTTGITKVLADFKRNQFNGRPKIVGSGLFMNYTLQQPYKTFDQAGLDTKLASANYDFFYDEDAALQWGSNNIGVFEKDSVQFVEFLMNRGAKAGDKGVSKFGILPIPMQTENGIVPVYFDYQMKYYDCATTLTDAYSGGSVSVERGWSLIISKRFGLWTIPSDSYLTGDELAGNRGSLLYTITNS